MISFLIDRNIFRAFEHNGRYRLRLFVVDPRDDVQSLPQLREEVWAVPKSACIYASSNKLVQTFPSVCLQLVDDEIAKPRIACLVRNWIGNESFEVGRVCSVMEYESYIQSFIGRVLDCNTGIKSPDATAVFLLCLDVLNREVIVEGFASVPVEVFDQYLMQMLAKRGCDW